MKLPRPPRVPRVTRTVRLDWLGYAKLRFTAANAGLSLSTVAGEAITQYAPSVTPMLLYTPAPNEPVLLNLRLLPEEATLLDNLALRLEVETDKVVTLGHAFASIVAQVPDPRPPIGTSDEIAAWLRATYSKSAVLRPERPFVSGWQTLRSRGFLSEARRAIRAKRRRNLSRR